MATKRIVEPRTVPSADETPSGIDASEPCPLCKTSRYLNPNMTLLVSPCYHKMCESCVSRIFATGSAPCPVCRCVVKRTDFVKPVFENLYVEKECRIRKRMWKIFNKTLDDFDGDLRAYNDYLQEVEELVFNLVNEADVQVMKDKLEQYQRENAELIQQNIEKQALTDSMLTQIMDEEVKDFKARRQEDVIKSSQQAQEKRQKKMAMIELMASSDVPVSEVIKQSKTDAVPSASDNDHDSSSRGPSLITRMSQLRERTGKSRLQAELPDFYGDPTASPYDRGQLLTVKDRYVDPSIHAFDNEQCRAGGFTVRMVYEKTISAVDCSLFVEPLK